MSEITSQQLHICASVLLDAQGRGAGGMFEGGEQALLQGAHFLSELASKPDTVIVPRELLRQTLAQADQDNDDCEARLEPDHYFQRKACEAIRSRIAELRRAAGMEDG